METKFWLSHRWCTHVKLIQIGTSTWSQVGNVFSSLAETHCQPGTIDNGTLALLSGTCILFPDSRPVFEQKSWEPRSYTGHIQCLWHLLPPSKLRSRSDSPWKPNFGSAIDDVPMSNWFKLEPQHGARLAVFSACVCKSSRNTLPTWHHWQWYISSTQWDLHSLSWQSSSLRTEIVRTQKLYRTYTAPFAPASTIKTS